MRDTQQQQYQINQRELATECLDFSPASRQQLIIRQIITDLRFCL
jgi:hypothetical protein